MTYLDGLSSLPQLSGYSQTALLHLKAEATAKLYEIVSYNGIDMHIPAFNLTQYIQLGPFAIRKGPLEPQRQSFNLTVPTSCDNAIRILRACQLMKPILLEGSPGVGKTSLIMALANISGHHLCRINLSDQTDLIDLFGSDLPVEGGALGEFAWRDAEFLKALQEGHWVLLDEMNLAPQAVLEGLNAVLDHRGTVYIPELGRSFVRHPSFRIFAAQNPLNQGGGRKGLPKSFVNRFTKVYVEELTPADLLLVCQHLFPQLGVDLLQAMISFNTCLNEEVTVKKLFGRDGAPWEFNLRDVIRWGCLLSSHQFQEPPMVYLQSIYLQRFRTERDRQRAQEIFHKIFVTSSVPCQLAPLPFISSSQVRIGHFSTSRNNQSSISRPKYFLKSHLVSLETLGDCLSQNWLAILTGSHGSGKSSLVRALANAIGNPLREISINSATDTMDLIGSFEQIDTQSQLMSIMDDILCSFDHGLKSSDPVQEWRDLLHARDQLRISISSPMTQDTIPLLLSRMSQLISNSSAYIHFPQDVLGRYESLTQLASSASRFEWADGPLVQAMRRGEWLLLDGANLCNPSVLDRLNSLCESNGQLILNERGLIHGAVEIIKPHSNFRLFMTVDPQFGELSRAMRNRGVEICLFPEYLSDDYLVMLDNLRLPPLSVSLEHANILFLKFQSHRRGLSRFRPRLRDAVALSGRLFDQFSALSSIADRFPLYLVSKTGVERDAVTFFLSRTIHHAYLPYFHRILETCHPISRDLQEYLHFVVNYLSSPRSLAIVNRIRKGLLQNTPGNLSALVEYPMF